MRTVRLTLALTALTLAVSALPARADESNKLTYLTFSAPIDLPGVSLPAGKYRFELADTQESRRVIKVSNGEGTKVFAMLLTMPNQTMRPAADPVVMFQETAPGMPHAVKAWFYPGESIGYEFIYPREQALKIAKAARESVLSTNEGKVGRVNERDEFASVNDAKTASLANSGAITTVDSSSRAAARREPAASPERGPAATARRAQADAANAAAAARQARPEDPNAASPSSRAVGTSGQQSADARRELPRTASPLPWVALTAAMLLCAALGARYLSGRNA